jgi:hypothetical protein
LTFTSSSMFGSFFGFSCVLVCTIFTSNHDVQFYAVLHALLHHVVPHQTMMRNSMNFYMFYCTMSSSNLIPLQWERKYQSTTHFQALKKDFFFGIKHLLQGQNNQTLWQKPPVFFFKRIFVYNQSGYHPY